MYYTFGFFLHSCASACVEVIVIGVHLRGADVALWLIDIFSLIFSLCLGLKKEPRAVIDVAPSSMFDFFRYPAMLCYAAVLSDG